MLSHPSCPIFLTEEEAVVSGQEPERRLHGDIDTQTRRDIHSVTEKAVLKVNLVFLSLLCIVIAQICFPERLIVTLMMTAHT